MTTTYHTAVAVGESNAPSTINSRLATLDAAIVARAAEINMLNTSGVGSVYAQINNGAGEADTSWVVDNISGTFLAGATVVFTVSGVVYSATVAANTSASPLTVTAAPAVTIPDNTVIAQVPAGVAGRVLESVRNVVDPTYGADASGATDSRTAVNSAIANAAAGETVYFPKGTYDLGTGDITIPDGVILRGDGATLSVDSGRRCFSIGSNVQIHGLKFDGNDDASANTTSRFFQILEETNVLIRDCEFNDMGNKPIAIAGSTYVTIDNCRFTNLRQASGIAGISVGPNDDTDTASTHIKITNCSFVNANISSDGAAAIILVGDNTNDLQIEHVIIENCFFEYMGRRASASGPRGDIDVYNDVKHLRISRCVSLDSAHSIIKCSDCEDFMMDSCTVINPAAQGIIFSYRYGNTLLKQARITNNYIYNAGLDGIDVSGGATSAPAGYAEDIIIAHNEIYYVGRYGVQVTEGRYINIIGNIIRSPGYGSDADSYNGHGIIVSNTNAITTPVPVVIIGNTIDMGGENVTAILLAVKENDTGATEGGVVVVGNVIQNTTSIGINCSNSINAILNANQFSAVTTHYQTGTVRLKINGVGTNAGAPTASSWQIGDLIVDTSNNRLYVKKHDGNLAYASLT